MYFYALVPIMRETNGLSNYFTIQVLGPCFTQNYPPFQILYTPLKALQPAGNPQDTRLYRVYLQTIELPTKGCVWSGNYVS